MIELKPLMLKSPRLTLAVAESLTCGLVQARIGAISGASEFFLGGITAYALDLKVKHLGVDRVAAKRVNSVSAEVAQQMARGACRLFGSDLALATTGYAEPSPAAKVPTPFAFWALVHVRRGRIVARIGGRVECPGATRVETQAIVAAAAVAELTDYVRRLRT
ncbi:MAG: damage-inducible protein CinA [Verrucomicrobia bacterium]|nr:damage-inducible protein CinA [Verrucomicrobiota bacterium]